MPNDGSDAYGVRKKRDSVSLHVKLHARQTITEDTQVLSKENGHRLQTTNRLMVVKVLLKCDIRLSILLVRIFKISYGNFSSTCVRCTHLLKS